MWGRISTRDRLAKYNAIMDTRCPICEHADESLDHLFFKCDYTSKCYEHLCQQIHVSGNVNSLKSFSRWVYKPCLGNFRKKLIQSSCAAFLYQIWNQRNEAIWNKKILQHSKLVARVKGMFIGGFLIYFLERLALRTSTGLSNCFRCNVCLLVLFHCLLLCCPVF